MSIQKSIHMYMTVQRQNNDIFAQKNLIMGRNMLTQKNRVMRRNLFIQKNRIVEWKICIRKKQPTGTEVGESGHDHGHIHEHRGMKEIREILLNSEMTDRAKETALHIFQILAKAEAKAHGVSEEQVHFHEVGAGS